MEADMLCDRSKSLLVLIDLQEKLMPAIKDQDAVIKNALTLSKAARRLEIPQIISEQNPLGLGATVGPLLEAAGDTAKIVSKSCFSAQKDEEFLEVISAHLAEGRRQILICGVEAHICVLQTAIDLFILKAVHPELEVMVVVDATGSRKALSMEMAFKRLSAAGVSLLTTEMVLFEWLGHSGHEAFKDLRRLIL